MFNFIAEVGINHNGSLDTALDLIYEASNAGCDIVKFQKRTPSLCVPEEQKRKIRYGTPWGDITYLEYKEAIEFGEEEYNEIDNICRQLNIPWTASAWDVPSAEFINSYEVAYNKIPSAKLTDKKLLRTIARYHKHTFISTGMSTMQEISDAVEIFRRANCPFELMHSVACYPMRNEDANLKVMEMLRDVFKCPVGWSGHERGLQISLAAVALGASSIERHITLDRSAWGSDQAASLGISGLRQLVRDCTVIREALGNGRKEVLPCEEEKKRALR